MSVAAVLTSAGAMLVGTVGLFVPARWCYDPVFYLWSRAILAAAGVRMDVVHGDPICTNQAYFFVGNHQSAMDIPVMGVVTRGRIRFMAKRSLFSIPLLGWCMRLGGCAPIDRSSARAAKVSIDRMLERLARRPVSMVVFPEGTRSVDGRLSPFKRGALQVCQRAGLPIVPFAIDGALAVHARSAFRIRPGLVRVSLGAPLHADEVRMASPDALLARVEGEVRRMLSAADPSNAAAMPLALVDGVAS